MDTLWRNDSGKFLSSYQWLLAHHKAKLPERILFAKELCAKGKKAITDLGCGYGLWLDLISQYAEADTVLTGIDTDENALANAVTTSASWQCSKSFMSVDIQANPEQIPSSDVFLLFNMISYVKDPTLLLNTLKTKLNPEGLILIRQFDGAAFHFGPMKQEDRLLIQNSELAAMGISNNFNNYCVDELYELSHNLGFASVNITFEYFERESPFPEDFIQYFSNELQMMKSIVSARAAEIISRWENKYLLGKSPSPAYCLKRDLIVELQNPIRT